MDSVLGFFNQGTLDRALSQAQLALKAKAGDEGLRFLLVQLYLLDRQYEKALTHLNLLELAVAPDVQKAFSVHCYNQIAQALSSRQLFFNQRKLVEVDVSDMSEKSLQVLLHRLTGVLEGADDNNSDETTRQARVHTSDGAIKQGEWLDPDDLLRGFIECISPQGKYRLIPMEQLASLTFEPPKKPLDCLLQRVTVTWKTTHSDPSRQETLLHLNIYPFAPEGAVNLNTTDWDAQRLPSGIVGIGQKVFCLDDELIAVSQLRAVEFES
ncbi:type VI secretion system accessory protein TagJ [Nitrincola sp. MINF-07-Sa-05]|uniref:type VI secretion system accessory protein TagJ n=1 Tax=Nitrincola salilacus TaxID=3400273 RepID=UPI003917E24B